MAVKLRIKGNSIRLRLTRSEVAAFAETGAVQDAIVFGPGPRLTYTLARTSAPALTASFDGGNITVSVPIGVADPWLQTDQIGFAGEQPLDAGETLRILVEKDFACLTVRPGEDDSDAYAHPLGQC